MFVFCGCGIPYCDMFFLGERSVPEYNPTMILRANGEVGLFTPLGRGFSAFGEVFQGAQASCLWSATRSPNLTVIQPLFAIRQRSSNKLTSSEAGKNAAQSGAFGMECRSQNEGAFLLPLQMPYHSPRGQNVRLPLIGSFSGLQPLWVWISGRMPLLH